MRARAFIEEAIRKETAQDSSS